MFRRIVVSPAYIIGQRDNKALWGFYAAIDGVPYLVALGEYTMEAVRKQRNLFVAHALAEYKRIRPVTYAAWNALFGVDCPSDALTLAELVYVANGNSLPT